MPLGLQPRPAAKADNIRDRKKAEAKEPPTEAAGGKTP